MLTAWSGPTSERYFTAKNKPPELPEHLLSSRSVLITFEKTEACPSCLGPLRQLSYPVVVSTGLQGVSAPMHHAHHCPTCPVVVIEADRMVRALGLTGPMAISRVRVIGIMAEESTIFPFDDVEFALPTHAA